MTNRDAVDVYMNEQARRRVVRAEVERLEALRYAIARLRDHAEHDAADGLEKLLVKRTAQ